MYSIMILILSALPFCCKGLALKDAKWDQLRVKWGLDPFKSNNFAPMPMLEQDAMTEGWVMKSDCSAGRHFIGTRYWKNDDPSVMLLYDVNGFIAGIQTGITKNVKTWSGEDYPFQQQINAPFVDTGDLYLITAYFKDPATVSTFGQTKSDFNTSGLGEQLYIQNGTLLSDVIKIPTHESEVESTGWTKGRCFTSMGVYYWYNVRFDTPCSNLFPVFLLYNEGELNAFGWLLQANVTGAHHFEHQATSSLSLYMKTVPSCLEYPGTLTSLHIYMTTRDLLNKC